MHQTTPLCPGIERFIAEVAVIYSSARSTDTVEQQRATYETLCRHFHEPHPPGVTAQDTMIGHVPVRVYRSAATNGHDAGCIIYIHGGGWVLGSVDTHDATTAQIAAETGAIVISIDYRLAPEHPFPAGYKDCRAVLAAVWRNAGPLGIDRNRIVVAGDSAGANLAAALTMVARADRLPLAGQALVYPVLGTDLTLPSYIENADAPMLRTVDMAHYWQLYLGLTPPRDWINPLVAPVTARDHSNLPRALIMTAGHDPVRDDGTSYASRLAQAGVPVSYRCASDLPHGYLRANRHSPSAAREFAALCEGLRVMTEAYTARRTARI
jgi:acetyl esterase